MENLNDKSLALEKQKGLDQEKGAEELNEIFSDLLPWTIESTDAAILTENTIQNRDEIERFFRFDLFVPYWRNFCFCRCSRGS